MTRHSESASDMLKDAPIATAAAAPDQHWPLADLSIAELQSLRARIDLELRIRRAEEEERRHSLTPEERCLVDATLELLNDGDPRNSPKKEAAT